MEAGDAYKDTHTGTNAGGSAWKQRWQDTRGRLAAVTSEMGSGEREHSSICSISHVI